MATLGLSPRHFAQAYPTTPLPSPNTDFVRVAKRKLCSVVDEYKGPSIHARKKRGVREPDTHQSRASTKPTSIVAQNIVTDVHPITPPISPPTPEATEVPAPPPPETPSRSDEKSHSLSGPAPPPDLSDTPPSTPTHNASNYGFNLHPGYASLWRKSRYPHCFMTHHLSGLPAIQGVIADAGGVQSWLERARDPHKYEEAQMHEIQDWRAATMFGDRNCRKYVVRDKFGCDASNRHCKKMMANLVQKIEEIAEFEVAWKQSYRLTNPSMSDEDLEEVIEGHRAYGGQATLEMYWKEEEAGILTLAEVAARVFMQSRGREREIAAAPDYPPDQDEPITTHMFNQTTPTQTAYMNTSPVIQIATGYTPDASVLSPPKRHRRQINAITSATSSEPGSSAPCRSILRTTPSSDRPPAGSDNNPSPKRPYQVYAMRCIDATIRPRARWRHYKNPRPQSYEPWTWSASPGSEPVDTNGAKRNPAEWEAYNMKLKYEAENMDMEEEGYTTDEEDEAGTTDKKDETNATGRAANQLQRIKSM
jgi:hypothetical protein